VSCRPVRAIPPEETMKAIASLIAVALLLVGLAGCASTPPPETTKVKCPACNYEFAPFAIGP